ncbi:hypothetical protein H4R99_000652 [Coemansia sp. RSA 1722]|nr:hypothetical protein IWW45_000535 [Coemansia sp. RSA 485]KAJ2606099.1 hypothetical protein H4R99_000652 [Coemansia sp. RSA 1722]
MKLTKGFLTLTAGLSVCHATELYKRVSTQDMDSFKGALLLKNGQQTSCEIALMRDTQGLVSANCLDYTDDSAKTVDMNTKYEVAISAGNDGTYGAFKVTKITPNPGYDPASFANNLAVIQFENGGRTQFTNYVASWRPDWKDLYYTRRTLFNSGNGGWNAPIITAYSSSSDSSSCSQANKLFSSNQDDFLCNQLSVTSIYNSSCEIPYGSVYGVNDPNIAIAALYSHSAVYGENNFCGNSKVYNYYTVLAKYMRWAMDVVGKATPVYHSNATDYKEPSDPNYSMSNPSSADTDGVTVVGGDVYNLKTRNAVVPSASEQSDIPDETQSSTPSSEPSSDSDDSKGISTGAILGIVFGLLALLTLVGLFARKKLRQNNIDLSSRVYRWLFNRENNINAYENGGALRPPSYITNVNDPEPVEKANIDLYDPRSSDYSKYNVDHKRYY